MGKALAALLVFAVTMVLVNLIVKSPGAPTPPAAGRATPARQVA